MDISTRRIGQVDVIHLRGAFRLGKAVDDFRTQSEALMHEGTSQLVLNLADVPMMDSSAIGTIVRVMTSAKSRGGGVKLVSPSQLVSQTLKMVGLLNIFEVFEDDGKAAQSFGNEASYAAS